MARECVSPVATCISSPPHSLSSCSYFASKANTFYNLDKYNLDGKWQDGTVRLIPCIASCKLHLLPSEPHWSPQTLSSCSYCALWTNTFFNEDRYILKPGQIYYKIWTNTQCISSPPHWSPQTLALCSLSSVIVTTKQCQCLYLDLNLISDVSSKALFSMPPQIKSSMMSFILFCHHCKV